MRPALVFGAVCECGFERVHVLSGAAVERLSRGGATKETLAELIAADVPPMVRLVMERAYREHHGKGHRCSFALLERELADEERSA